jgi:hypothetical protein
MRMIVLLGNMILLFLVPLFSFLFFFVSSWLIAVSKNFFYRHENARPRSYRLGFAFTNDKIRSIATSNTTSFAVCSFSLLDLQQ